MILRARIASVCASSYTMNEYLIRHGVDEVLHLDMLPSNSATVVAFEIADAQLPKSGGPAYARQWLASGEGTAWDRVLRDIQPDRHGQVANSQTHTTGQANYLYADGHVSNLSATTVKAMIDRSENIARPGS